MRFLRGVDLYWLNEQYFAIFLSDRPGHHLTGAAHAVGGGDEPGDVALLFLRGGNSGISHNPLETITADDTELCVAAFMNLLEQLAAE